MLCVDTCAYARARVCTGECAVVRTTVNVHWDAWRVLRSEDLVVEQSDFVECALLCDRVDEEEAVALSLYGKTCNWKLDGAHVQEAIALSL